MTLIEAADALGVSPSTLRCQIHRGKLRADKVGRDWQVMAGEVERYRRENRNPLHNPTASLVDRFWPHVQRSPTCWNWTGTSYNGGYGRIVLEGRRILAHRLSYELHIGAIPEGMTIDHLCRNRACVNPAHLEAVTLTENKRRGESFAAQNARRTHCIHGHPFDEANTLTTKEGRRVCRPCRRIRQWKRKHA